MVCFSIYVSGAAASNPAPQAHALRNWVRILRAERVEPARKRQAREYTILVPRLISLVYQASHRGGLFAYGSGTTTSGRRHTSRVCLRQRRSKQTMHTAERRYIAVRGDLGIPS